MDWPKLWVTRKQDTQGSLLGLRFPALYETDPSENTGLGFKGLSGVQGCSTSRGCAVLCVPGRLSPAFSRVISLCAGNRAMFV